MKIRKGVFPVAGLGTRFLPATKAQPKEMLPLVDKPLIQYVVEEAMASGIEEVIFVTGRGKNAIEDHFDISAELEHILKERGKTDLLKQVHAISEMIHVSYVRQKAPLGLGHAILMARNLVGDEPFAVFLGDDIIDSQEPCMAQMMRVFEKTQSSVIAIERIPGEQISSYGVIAAEPAGERIYKINNLVEKPAVADAPSDLAIIGRYILTPDIFDALERATSATTGEIELTNSLKSYLAENEIYGYEFEGVRHDAGNKLGFLKATVQFALKRDDLGKPFREYLRSLDL